MGLLNRGLPGDTLINVGWVEKGKRYQQTLRKEDAYRLKNFAKSNENVTIWWFERIN